MNTLGPAAESTAVALGHRVVLEGRRSLTVTGVTDVGSFDEGAAVLETNQGSLVLRGQALRVEKLDLEGGEVRLTGQIDSMLYEENSQSRESFLSRLLR